MNGKLTNIFINGVSILGTIVGFIQIIPVILSVILPEQSISIYQYIEGIVSVLAFVTLVILVIFIYRNKKTYVDLHTICSSMALNNRLQSLREIVLIKDREISGKNHTYRIKTAKFDYILSQTKGFENSYDVHYTIIFELVKPWFMLKGVKNRIFRFFIITLAAAPRNFVAQISTEKKDFDDIHSRIMQCAKKNYTVRGESGSNEKGYTGLYEIISVIPPDMAKKKKIEIKFTYDIIGQIKKEQSKHSFTIIPKNYSSKINKMEIRVQTKNIQIDNLEFQRYGINGEFEIAELFIPCEPTIFSNLRESLTEDMGEDIYEHYTSTVPIMNSAYSVQFDLPDDEKSTKEGSGNYVPRNG